MAEIFLVKMRGLTINISKQHHRIFLPRFISSTQEKNNYNNGGEGNNRSDGREEGEEFAGSTRLFSRDDAAKEAQEGLERKKYNSNSRNNHEEDSIVEEVHKIDGPVDTVEYRNIEPNIVEETN